MYIYVCMYLRMYVYIRIEILVQNADTELRNKVNFLH